MYDHLFGEILRKTPTSIVVDVQGVGYFVEASLRTTAALAVGSETRVLVHHRQTEDSVRLFGFVDEAERELFRNLLKVNGVGPAHALALLSTSAPEEIWASIRDGSEKRLTASKGIGPKIAQRLIVELKDEAGRKAPKGAGAAAGAPAMAADAVDDDALGALVVLGYSEGAALKAVHAAKKKLGKGVAVEVLVREALNQR